MSDNIKIFVTGGTIDDLDYELEENAPKNHRSLIPGLLEQSRITIPCSVEVLMQKDSRAITTSDRLLLLDKCKDCHESKILITHGTATMPETAAYLNKVALDKTIVLFGAIIPASKEGSDALFNLGVAISAVQTLPNGVFVAMNGRVFPADNVRKNFSAGYFEQMKEK